MGVEIQATGKSGENDGIHTSTKPLGKFGDVSWWFGKGIRKGFHREKVGRDETRRPGLSIRSDAPVEHPAYREDQKQQQDQEKGLFHFAMME